MNCSKRILLIAGLINLYTCLSYAEEFNMAFIDMEIIFQSYYKTIKADDIIKKQTEIYKEYALNLDKERGIIQEEFNELRDESHNIALSDEIREQKRNEAQSKFMMLQEKKKDIQEYQQEKRLSLRKQYEDERQKLVKEISEVVKVFAEQKKYTLVVDSSGNTLNGIPVFVYYKTDNDITQKIIDIVNKGHEHELKKPNQQTPQANAPPETP